VTLAGGLRADEQRHRARGIEAQLGHLVAAGAALLDIGGKAETAQLAALAGLGPP